MNNIVLRPSYWANVSGGKDSLFMLKLILENIDKYPLDGVVHFELEIDYPFIKNVIDYMEQQCISKDIKFVRIKPRNTWIDLYNKYGYPSRVNRWCNSKYKLDGEKQLRKFLKTQGCFLVNYIGLCADEEKRFRYKETKDGIPLVIYPLVEYNIKENTILEWAKNQPIFNDYYKYNKRCGCMCCPLSSINNLVYTKKYYPEEYEYFMTLALKHEKILAERYERKKFSVWSSNPKYDTLYRIKRVDDIIKGVPQSRRERRFYMENTEVMILSDKKFETCSKAFNKELNAILDAQRKGLKAGESIAEHLLNIRTAELWKNKDGEPIVVDGVECNTFGDVATLFGMGKQQAYKLASAYNLKYNEETLIERLASFTLGQITEMLRLSVSDIMLLIDEGRLTNNLTLKGIRAVVDEYKEPEEHKESETADSDIEVGDDLPESEEETDNTIHVYLGKNELVLTDKDYSDFMKWLTKRSYL